MTQVYKRVRSKQSTKVTALNYVFSSALRIEWCRARSRAMGWSEEILFLREEMRRVLEFFEWHAGWWDERKTLHTGLSAQMEEGMIAYASKQAYLRRSMRSRFDRMWRDSKELIGLGVRPDTDILDLTSISTMDILHVPSEEVVDS